MTSIKKETAISFFLDAFQVRHLIASLQVVQNVWDKRPWRFLVTVLDPLTQLQSNLF